MSTLPLDTYRNLAARRAVNTPRRVSVLPPELANQIAAGEVVERPASVVKELVENSMDAGAGRVEVTIEEGGRALIRIEDDGCGMSREDALRALERHATSKITCVDDLFNIGTLGFRGEALPSIASVSRVEIKTKPHGEISGTRIVVRGGHVEVVEEVGMPAGTTITVEDIFYNTPARLKFLKTPSTESRHITEMLIRMGLSRPDVRFVLKRDGKTRLDLPVAQDVKDRILAIMSREVYDVMYPTFEFPAVNGIVARGYFSKPGHVQRTANNIYVFVNGRYVNDRTISAAIKGAYGTLMERGKYASIVLFLDVPCELVDVNVHPAKHEVRFNDTNSVYRAVYHAISDALAEGPWVKREAKSASRVYALSKRDDSSDAQAAASSQVFTPTSTTIEPLGATHRRQHQMDASALQLSRYNYRNDQGPSPKGMEQPPELGPKITYHDMSPGALKERQQGFSAQGAQPLSEPPKVTISEQAPGEHHVAIEASEGYFSALRVIGQFKRQYIVCEDASGLVVIDQHAAHERVGYERLKALFATEHKEHQPLLFPKRIELDTLRSDIMSEHLDFFIKAGFEIEHFGGQSYALKSVPAVLQKANVDKLVRDVLDDLAYHGRTNRLDEAMDAILSRMACHSVVRGPTVLSNEECMALFEQMDAIDFAANCPHGRPVYFRISLMELEASFDRR